MIEVFTKEITTLDWIDIEEIDTHNTQKENFPEYNKEVYVSEDYEFNEANKKKILILKYRYCKDRKFNNNETKVLVTMMTRDTLDNKKSKNKIIEQKEVWKKAVKQIETIMKKVFNIVWKLQKSESSMKLYNLKWILTENNIQNMILWKEKLWVIELWKVVQKIHQKRKKMLLIDMQTIQSQTDFYDLENMIRDETQKKKMQRNRS